MTSMHYARHAAATLFLALFAAAGFAQDKPAAQEFQPEVGQAGKDVVWVPTSQALVNRMLELGKLTAKDNHIDLGSGDGRTVITAAKRGATSLGIEYNPDMVALSQRAAAKEGVTARATFRKADLFETDLSQATLITLFLLPDINLRLRPKILDLKPGTRIVSNTFTMDDWEADAVADLGADGGCSASWCTALLWIVPAKVGGVYRVSQGDLVLIQKFQMLSGTLNVDGKMHPLTGKVTGEDIRFTAGGREYRGRLNGKSMDLR